MTNEDKTLLLKNLCSRLPYGVIVETTKGKGHVCNINLTIFENEVGVNINPTSRNNFNMKLNFSRALNICLFFPLEP